MEKRIQQIRERMDKLGITQSRVATASGLALITIKKTLSPSADSSTSRYLNETTVAAIEKGLESIVDEYRQEICGEKKAS